MSSSLSESARSVRERLDALGERRRALNESEEALREETKVALRQAQGVIPIAEAARRAALNRSTVYELYLRDDDAQSRAS